MKQNFQAAIEDCRITRGPWRTQHGQPFGAFHFDKGRNVLRVLASPPHPNGTGWEHVSVSAAYRTTANKWKPRTPNWEEMGQIKSRFFDEEETVIQFHPARSLYVNFAGHCLHLWRWGEGAFPVPSIATIGPTGNAEQDAAAFVSLVDQMETYDNQQHAP